MRKALCIGIDNYYNSRYNLHGCVNDANKVKDLLERNEDETLNFETRLMYTDNEKYITKSELKDAIQELFENDSELAVLYYSGHGALDSLGGYLCTSEVRRADEGLSLDDVMKIIAQSKAKNKVVILDCCHSGFAGDSVIMQGNSILTEGTIILAACDKHQYSLEENGMGVFTSLLIEALNGGAMNLLGEVSPGSIYAYIDRSLGAWEQRPIFKANIKNFVSLRKNLPPIKLSELHRITEFFKSPHEKFSLDPTYEPDKHEADTPEVNKEHEEIFAILQKYVSLNLVIPFEAKHMYYAAINRKSCKLTAQGQHYWYLVKKNRI